MNNDLIERYLYAVTRRMNPKIREDVSRELRGLIEDMLTERCGTMTPTEKDVRVVLTEIGSPQELYEKYDEDSKKCLIGQPYYSDYKFVLKIILSCSAFGLTLAAVILQLMEPQQWYAALGNWLAMLWNGMMGAFAFTTLLYAFFYHRGIKMGEPFNFDDLPPVPKKKQEISGWECVFGIGFSVIFLIVFLAAPQICGIIYENGEWLPIFRTETIHQTWYIIVLFSLTGIVREVVKLLERQYNSRVLVTTVLCDVLSAVLSVWWLGNRSIINPAFTEKMSVLFAGEGVFIAKVFSHFQYFFLGVILFALVLDTGTAMMKTLQKS